MSKLYRWSMVAVMAAALGGGTVMAQQAPLTPADIATIKKDVQATVEKYYSLFVQLNPKGIAEQAFNAPWILMAANGPQVDLTKEQAAERFQASMKQLQESGWGKSVYTTTNVCVLNAAAAITSGYNTRYKKDGSVMSVGGVSYILNKTKEGWRIISYTSTLSKDTIIKCD
jgi:hypothetical protein